MNQRKLLSVLLALGLLAASCGGSDADATTTTTTTLAQGGSQTTTTSGGEEVPSDEWPDKDSRERTLVIAAANVPGGFDTDALTPGTQETTFAGLFEPLLGNGTVDLGDGRVQSNPGDIVGLLAESWTLADDQLSYDFKLREGVISNYGNELTAADVEWSWNKSFEQARTGTFMASVSNVESVEAIDTYTVRFNLSAPSAVLLPVLTLMVPAIHDSTEVQKHVTADDPLGLEWMKTNVASFGAYQIESVSPEEAVFVANPNFYGGEAYFQRVIYRKVAEPTVRVQLLQAGEIDMMENPTAQNVIDLQGSSDIATLAFPSNHLARVLMNPNYPPFDQKEVRQAFNYATDGDQILSIVFQSLARQGKSPLPSLIPGFTPEFWDYEVDYDKARELLADAGYPDGLEVELLYSTRNVWEEPVAVQVKDSLAKAGVTVNLVKIPDAEMQERASVNFRDMPFFTYDDKPFVLDPAYALAVNSQASGCCDRENYANPEVQELIATMLVTPDLDDRIVLARRVQELHVDDATWIYTAEVDQLEAMGADIIGFVHHPDNHERWFELQRVTN